jgi:hypothetical protein
MASLEVVEGPIARPSSETVRSSHHEGSSIRADGQGSPISSGSAAGAAIGTERLRCAGARGRAAGKRRFGCRHFVWDYSIRVDVRFTSSPPGFGRPEFAVPVALLLEGAVPVEAGTPRQLVTVRSVRATSALNDDRRRERRAEERLGNARARVVPRCGARSRARKAVLAASGVRNKGRIGEVAARCQSAESEHQAAISWCEHSRRQPN